MNDLDDELLEMFRRREGDVRSPVTFTSRLVARTRRREWLPPASVPAAAIVVVVMSIAGLRSLGASDASQPRGRRPHDHEDRQRDHDHVPGAMVRAKTPSRIGIEPTVDGPGRSDPRPHTDRMIRIDRACSGAPPGEHPPGQLLDDGPGNAARLSGEASSPWPVPLRTWARLRQRRGRRVLREDGRSCAPHGPRRVDRSRLGVGVRVGCVRRRPHRVDWTPTPR